MGTMHRAQPAVLLLLAAALLACTATAGKPAPPPVKVVASAYLLPSADSDEPEASGTAKFQGVVSWNWYNGYIASGTLTVRCQSLTPFDTYRVSYAPAFVADANGNGTVKNTQFVGQATFLVFVDRKETDAAGNLTFVRVLEGWVDATPKK